MTECARTADRGRRSLPLLVSLFLCGPGVAGGNEEPASPLYVDRESVVLADRDGDGPGEEDEEEGNLEFGVELELTANRIGDVALDTERRDTLWVREVELVGEVTYRPRGNLLLFGEVSLVAEREDYGGDSSGDSIDALERGETWIRREQVFGGSGSVTIGRQVFEETRRWWWDDDLDALRVDMGGDHWGGYVGLAEEVARVDTSEDFIDPEVDDVRRLIAHVGWSGPQTWRVDLFGLLQRDRSGTVLENRVLSTERVDESDLDANWFGLRVSGGLEPDEAPALRYWADLATVSGDDTSTGFEELNNWQSRAEETVKRDLRAWAVDLGVEWGFPVRGAPSLSLRYAQGSGDPDPDDRTDRAYRETGLRDTEDEFRLYGELLRPELSNLRIATMALGLDLPGDGRITFGYHRFRQVHAADELADSRIELDPTGDSPDIGDELSLVLQFPEIGELQLEFAAATFRAGNAFGSESGERANSLFAEATLEF